MFQVVVLNNQRLREPAQQCNNLIGNYEQTKVNTIKALQKGKKALQPKY